ncbi:MAG: type II toxin-antitoxin system RelE family toxin [Pseudonocardiaceae bacterium]
MTRVELAAAAVEDLDKLIVTHSLTRGRVRRSLAPLEEFPRLGSELAGRWAGMRLILCPWRWMLLVYRLDESGDRVVVVTIQDSRSSDAATSTR